MVESHIILYKINCKINCKMTCKTYKVNSYNYFMFMTIASVMAISSIVILLMGFIVMFTFNAEGDSGACLDWWPVCINPIRYPINAKLASIYNVNETEYICRGRGNYRKCNENLYNRLYAIYITDNNFTCNPLRIITWPLMNQTINQLILSSPVVNQTILYLDSSKTCYMINNVQRELAINSLIVLSVGIICIIGIIIMYNIITIKYPPIKNSWYYRRTAVIAINIDNYDKNGMILPRDGHSPSSSPARDWQSMVIRPLLREDELP